MSALQKLFSNKEKEKRRRTNYNEIITNKTTVFACFILI